MNLPPHTKLPVADFQVDGARLGVGVMGVDLPLEDRELAFVGVTARTAQWLRAVLVVARLRRHVGTLHRASHDVRLGRDAVLDHFRL